MAGRIIRNDFVAGEIDPGLWGRTDQELYWHGAAKLQNFIPRRTGGIRKRAGTELVWKAENTGTNNKGSEWRIIPYRFDKDECGLLALYRKRDASGDLEPTLHWGFKAFYAGDRTNTASGSTSVSIDTSTPLSAIRYTQIGDTLYFTCSGRRAFTARITFYGPSVKWSELNTKRSVATAPALTATPSDFGDSGTDDTRTYRLWGVLDGVRGAHKGKTATIKNPWLAGATVTVSFTPNWAKHDYYILAKLQAGQFGELKRFYPEPKAQTATYSEVAQDGNDILPSRDGWEGRVGGSVTINSTWGNSSVSPNDTITNGQHKCGAFVRRVKITLSDSKPVTHVRFWFGAKMKRTSDNKVSPHSYPSTVWITLSNGNSEAQTWSLIPSYTSGSVDLALEGPSSGSEFTLVFYETENRNSFAYVPMRGAKLIAAENSTLSFVDNNIAPGTSVGEQDLLSVGTVGMDVDHINVWEQRLLAAGSQNSPFTLWFSTVGDLTNFYVDRPQSADNAFEATIAATEASRILHVVAQKWLLVFTEAGEYVVSSSSGALSYATVQIRKISSIGAHPDIPPVVTETEVLFVAADARSVYRMDYSLEKDSVVPTEASIRATHLTENHRIRKIAYQRYPDSVLWCLLDDGSLASLTLDPAESVCAWARHVLAGGAGLVAEDIIDTGRIRSDAETDTTSDIMLVLRHPSLKPGAVWIERMRPCVVNDAPKTSAAQSVDHMGYSASVRPDGSTDPGANVSASMETLRMDPPGSDMIGRTGCAYDAALRLRRSGIVRIRAKGSDKWATSARQPDATPTLADSRVSLVGSDVRIAPYALQNRDARMEIESADEWPCEILEICAAYTFGTLKSGG